MINQTRANSGILTSGSNSYIAIDLKSFYASVECKERGLDPLTANLVVADPSRTDKTICLAVSPSLKALGIPGRCRLFEVKQQVAKENARRAAARKGAPCSGISSDAKELAGDPSLDIGFIIAVPRMALYMEYSTRVLGVYLQYVSREDIHVYSIDEVMIDVTSYLKAAAMTPRQMCAAMIRDVAGQTGLTATGGVGTNLYLCKVAMDIMAKHIEPDEDGVRIAELDEESYRRYFWTHRPLTDFWRVGRGTVAKLERYGIRTMGDIARTSLESPDLLYKLFGINAEFLIDHAWGRETATMQAIRQYRPQSESIGSGQVLPYPYTADKARLIVSEMADALAMELMDNGLQASAVVLTVAYDIDNMKGDDAYSGETVTDWYGRKMPKHAHGTGHLPFDTSLASVIIDAAEKLYDSIVDPKLLVRRIFITVLLPKAKEAAAEDDRDKGMQYEQLSLFDLGGTGLTAGPEDSGRKQGSGTGTPAGSAGNTGSAEELEKQEKLQHALLDIRKKYGANALMRGRDLEEGATTRERNAQIGGHKA